MTRMLKFPRLGLACTLTAAAALASLSPAAADAAPMLKPVTSKSVAVLRPHVTGVFAQTTTTSPIFQLTEPGAKYDSRNRQRSRSQFRLTKYTKNGHIDRRFGQNGSTQIVRIGRRSEDWDYDVVPLNDGRIAVHASDGYYGSWRVSDGGMAIVVFRADGELDTRFSGDGISILRLSRKFPHVAVLANKVVALGPSGIGLCGAIVNAPGGSGAAVQALGVDGNPDPGFGGSGTVRLTPSFVGGAPMEEFANCQLAIGGDSLTVVATGRKDLPPYPGAPDNYESRLIRVTQAGALDNSFGVAGQVTLPKSLYDVVRKSGEPQLMVEDFSGRIVIKCELYVTGNEDYPSKSLVTRFNGDGTRDMTFGSRGFVKLDPFFYTIVPRRNGSLLLFSRDVVKLPRRYHHDGYNAYIAPSVTGLGHNGAPDPKMGKDGHRAFKGITDAVSQVITVHGRKYFYGPYRYTGKPFHLPGPPTPMYYLGR